MSALTEDWRGLTASNLLGSLCLEAYTAASPTELCAQASVAERQLSSRLSGGEAVYVSSVKIKIHQAKQKRQNS